MDNKTKKSKTPLVLGIVGLVTWLIPIIGIIVSVIGIVLSLKSLKIIKCKAYKIILGLNIVGVIATIANFAIGLYIILN